ncbi:MAG: citramalate synthase [Solirubrobacteraceae bacterium]|nr:citramalate synthase [Solirubrobacteraceae bacterium]
MAEIAPTPAPARIELYDATLRDGMGGGGMSLTAEEKVRLVHRLDGLGIDIVEAGFPASNPKEAELFARLEHEELAHATIAAFGMTRRRGVPAAEDAGLRVLAGCFAPVCTIVGKTSINHVEKVVRVSREENLAMIAESVAYLVAQGKRVIFDCEHVFDGLREDRDYTLACLGAAAGAGAERLVLCDTNGPSLPGAIARDVAAVRAALPGVALGIHCHDDGGCAVANTLMAVEAGATQVQGTMNGIGERTGNANLITIIANLQLKMGHRVVSDEQLRLLTDVAHFTDELLNRQPNAHQPYVGKHAFAHKAGLHAAGIRADATTFEHVDPALVGNHRDLLVSELSGRGTVVDKAERAGLELDDATTARVLERMKALEHDGYQFEAADGSFELLLRKESGEYQPLFRLESWRVTAEQHADGEVKTEAAIKIWADGERFVSYAEGNGPVHALDKALRAVLTEAHPHLAETWLTNFKVRILDETKGSDATIRVLIDATDGVDSWGSIGVSTNLIAASWAALVDSLEYAEQPSRVRGAAAP